MNEIINNPNNYKKCEIMSLSQLFLFPRFLLLLSIFLTIRCRKTKDLLYMNNLMNTYGQYKLLGPRTFNEERNKLVFTVPVQNRKVVRHFRNGTISFPYGDLTTNSLRKNKRDIRKRNSQEIHSKDYGNVENVENVENVKNVDNVGNVKNNFEESAKKDKRENEETIVRSEGLENMDIISAVKEEIIAEKIANEKNQVIRKLKLPILGTQLKPSGGYTKQIMDLIKQSNEYINTINKEIIKKKMDDKLTGNDLSFFDDDKLLEEHEVNYLNQIYDNNYVLNIYNLLLVWKKKKNIDLSVFVSKISETTNMMPGERTVVKFSEIEKAQFLKKIKMNRNVCIPMIFVDNKNRSGMNSTDDSNMDSDGPIMHNMMPVGILAHPLDISLLDKSGEISVLILFRFKITNYKVTETDFIVNAELLTDSNSKMNNLELTLENKKIIINLYDKLLDLKIKYNEKIGNTSENEKLKHLEKITERIDEYVNILNVNKSINLKNNHLDFYTALYLEYFSFLALDIHANIQTKLQLMYTDNTELRLHNVKTFLLQLYDDLKVKLRGL